MDFLDDFCEDGGIFCFHDVCDASGWYEHAGHQFFGGFPEFCLFFGWCEVEVGDEFSQSLFVHLFAVVIVPLDNFLLVGRVIAVAHGSVAGGCLAVSVKRDGMMMPAEAVESGI